MKGYKNLMDIKNKGAEIWKYQNGQKFVGSILVFDNSN